MRWLNQSPHLFFIADFQFPPIRPIVREAFLQKRQSLLWLATQKRMDMLRSLTADFVLLLKITCSICRRRFC